MTSREAQLTVTSLLPSISLRPVPYKYTTEYKYNEGDGDNGA